MYGLWVHLGAYARCIALWVMWTDLYQPTNSQECQQIVDTKPSKVNMDCKYLQKSSEGCGERHIDTSRDEDDEAASVVKGRCSMYRGHLTTHQSS